VSDILVLQVVVLGCGTAAFVASLRFLRQYLELRHERSLRTPATEVLDRLESIEQTVESTAVEVERLAEANRFMAKLLAERNAAIGSLAKTPERVITPH
jgi:hypothetical protein